MEPTDSLIIQGSLSFSFNCFFILLPRLTTSILLALLSHFLIFLIPYPKNSRLEER